MRGPFFLKHLQTPSSAQTASYFSLCSAGTGRCRREMTTKAATLKGSAATLAGSDMGGLYQKVKITAAATPFFVKATVLGKKPFPSRGSRDSNSGRRSKSGRSLAEGKPLQSTPVAI